MITDLDEALEERVRFDQPTTDGEKWVNRIADELDALSGDRKLLVRFLKKKKEYRLAYASVLYAEKSPKEIPIDELREVVTYDDSGDSVISKYKERVRSPLTGIRAFCVKCQGGQVAEVRECPSSNCPLWAFRMGNNPFYGKLADADTESENEPLVESNDAALISED